MYDWALEPVKAPPKHPEIEVALCGESPSAFSILGRVSQALRQGGHGDEAKAFYDEATSGDYAHMLATCFRWVEVT